MSVYFILHADTRHSWPVNDPAAWAMASADQSVLERARAGLTTLTNADRDRVVRLVTRRCGLHVVEVRDTQVVVQYWVKVADLRPFFKQHGLARRDVKVVLAERKREILTVRRRNAPVR